jgi:hypothetical protein
MRELTLDGRLVFLYLVFDIKLLFALLLAPALAILQDCIFSNLSNIQDTHIYSISIFISILTSSLDWQYSPPPTDLRKRR